MSTLLHDSAKKIIAIFFVLVSFLFSQNVAHAATTFVAAAHANVNANSATVSKPTGTATNDIMFTLVMHKVNEAPNTVPTGWTLSGTQVIASTYHYSLYWKLAATEGASYTWGWPTSERSALTVVTYRGGFNTASPIDILSNTAYTTTNATVRAASMNVAVTNSPIIFFGAIYFNGGTTFTPPTTPATMTENVDSYNSTSRFSREVANLTWTGSGTTGNMDAITGTSFGAVKHAFAVALKPADTTPPTPNPMTFATLPANDSATQISMTGTTAADASTPPVTYLFTNDNTNCGANAGTGGASSAWQTSTAYSNSGLQANKCYGYTITARDSVTPTPNTGIASSISLTYTSANTPGTPTLNGATATTLNLTNTENGNPASSPTTNFAVQVITTNPSDANWLNKWVNASGNPSSTAVWLTDAQLDTMILHSMQSSTLYGMKVKARNNDTDETPLSAEGQGTTSSAPVTTLSNFVTAEPSNVIIAPETSAQVDSFSLQTSVGSDTVTGATVTLATGTGARVATVAITNNNDTLTYCNTTPSGDTATLTGCSIPVNTTNTQFKIKITAIAHTAMPTPPGAFYAINGIITAFTGTNAQAGTDSGSATITIDNLSPNSATSVSGSAGNAQITLNWTNPIDSDYISQIVLRREASTITNTPTEGIVYTVGNTIGTATVACVVTTPTATCTDTGLINGNAYHYKIFSKDSSGNYSTGAVPTNSPFTPSLSPFTLTSSVGVGGMISPLGITNVAQGSNQIYTITPNLGYDVATITDNGSPQSTTTSYTIGNIQANHTITVTFIQITPTYTITGTAGANGTISPLGATIFLQGASQTYTITPISGYVVATLIVDSVSIATSTSHTFSGITANHTIDVTFSLIPPPLGTFAITATAGTNGSISPTGVTIVTQGNAQTYTITPASGCSIGTLTVDGSSLATTTSYTFTNVQTNHTIDATFVALPAGAPLPDTGTTRATTITFSGKAFPGGAIQVIDKTLNDEKLYGQKDIIKDDGSFSIPFIGIFQTLHSFGFIAKDPLGRPSQTKFFMIDTRSDDFVIKNILVPPTIDLVSGQVSRGSDALIVGYASPLHIVQIKLDGIIKGKIIAEKDGSYAQKIPTGDLTFGQHKVQATQIDPTTEKDSDSSLSRTFVVSRLSVVKADLSGDGKIDIRDWSIFLSRWLSKDPLLKASIDLNGDGKVNIVDFSIFIKTIRK